MRRRISENRYDVLGFLFVLLALLCVGLLWLRFGANIKNVHEYELVFGSDGYIKAMIYVMAKPALMILTTVMLGVTIWKKSDFPEMLFYLLVIVSVLCTVFGSIFFSGAYYQADNYPYEYENFPFFVKEWVMNTDTVILLSTPKAVATQFVMVSFDVTTIALFMIGLLVSKKYEFGYFILMGLSVVATFVLLYFYNGTYRPMELTLFDQIATLWLEMILIGFGCYHILYKNRERRKSIQRIQLSKENITT